MAEKSAIPFVTTVVLLLMLLISKLPLRGKFQVSTAFVGSLTAEVDVVVFLVPLSASS
jgi:hypothetical protein